MVSRIYVLGLAVVIMFIAAQAVAAAAGSEVALPAPTNQLTSTEYVLTTAEGVSVSNGEANLIFDPAIVTQQWEGERVGVGSLMLVFTYKVTDLDGTEMRGLNVDITLYNQEGAELSFPTIRHTGLNRWIQFIGHPYDLVGISSFVPRLSGNTAVFPSIRVGMFPLHDAVKKRDIEQVNRLIELGVNVNAKNVFGSFALEMASEDGNAETVNLLLSNGADVNAEANDGRTAIDLADERGHQEIVEALRAAGAIE